MSLKVYTGCEIVTGNLNEVYRVVETFRPVVQRLAEAKFDAFTAGYSEWNRRRHAIKTTGLRDHAVDTDFNMTIFPFESVFYGMVFTEQSKWFDLWCTMPLVKNFSYWDNSDEDPDVPAHEWKRRKYVWDRIFKGNPLPCMIGWSIDIMDPGGPMPKGWMRDARHG